MLVYQRVHSGNSSYSSTVWLAWLQPVTLRSESNVARSALCHWPRHIASLLWATGLIESALAGKKKRSINAVALLKRLMGSHMPLNVLSCRGRAVPVQDMLSKCWSYLKLYHEVTGFRHKKSCRSRRNKRIINRTQQELPKIWPWSMTAHPWLGLLICGWLWTCGCLQKDNKKRAFLKKGTSTVYRCL